MTADTALSSAARMLLAPAMKSPAVILRPLLSPLLPPLALAALFALSPAARAAHPLQTEDTGTQGAGNVEIENGFQRAKAGATRLFTYQPQVSVGLAPTFDAIVQPSWVSLQAPGQAGASGLGDTNLDAKWRFWGVDPWSLAVRAGVAAPTSQHGLGLPKGEVSEHALLVATWDSAPTTAHFNLGVAHTPRDTAAPGARATVAHASAAVMQAVNERFIVTVDSEIDQNPASNRSGAVGSVLGGLIWTAWPGLDLDVGYQLSVHAQPVNRQWMAGLTYRFAL